MNATLTATERAILLGIAAGELAAREAAAILHAVPSVAYVGARRVQHGRDLLRLEEATRWGPRVDLASWLQVEPTPAVRQAGSRARARLEAAGLVARSAPAGGRLTHARLTAAGREAVAEGLLGEGA